MGEEWSQIAYEITQSDCGGVGGGGGGGVLVEVQCVP